MGPTAIIARSQFVPDFNGGYMSPEVLEGILPKRQPYEGDYHGVIRGAGEGEYFDPPPSFGVQRKVVVPAGTLVIMFYDTWHRATPSLLPSDVHLPPEERDRSTHRWMSKFRFWRMEEPAGPTWEAGQPDECWAPPVDKDVDFPREFRMDGVGRSIFGWMSGNGAPIGGGTEDGTPVEVLQERLAWHGDAWCCRLDDEQRVERVNPVRTPRLSNGGPHSFS